MRVGEVRDGGEDIGRGRGRGELGTLDQGLAGAGLEHAVGARVGVRRAKRRAADRALGGSVSAAPDERDGCRSERELGDRLAARQPNRDPAHPWSPATIGSRVARRATHSTAAPESSPSPIATSAISPAPAASSSEAYPTARRAIAGPSSRRSSSTPTTSAGTTTATAAPPSSARTAPALGTGCAQHGDGGAAFSSGQHECLHERVEADEAVDDRDGAQDRGERGDQAAPLADRARGRRGARPERGQARLHRGSGSSRTEANRDLLLGGGFRGEQRTVGDVDHAPVVLQRVHDSGHAQPGFAARGKLDGERGADGQAENLRETVADLHFAVPAQATAGEQRGRLEDRVIAGIGNHVDRLAE